MSTILEIPEAAERHGGAISSEARSFLSQSLLPIVGSALGFTAKGDRQRAFQEMIEREEDSSVRDTPLDLHEEVVGIYAEAADVLFGRLLRHASELGLAISWEVDDREVDDGDTMVILNPETGNRVYVTRRCIAGAGVVTDIAITQNSLRMEDIQGGKVPRMHVLLHRSEGIVHRHALQIFVLVRAPWLERPELEDRIIVAKKASLSAPHTKRQKESANL